MPFLKQENLVSMKTNQHQWSVLKSAKHVFALFSTSPCSNQFYLCWFGHIFICVAWLPVNTLSLPNLWLLHVICICFPREQVWSLLSNPMLNLQIHLWYKLHKKSIILKAILLAHYSDLVYSSGFAKKYYIRGGCKTIICTDIWNKRLNCYIIF